MTVEVRQKGSEKRFISKHRVQVKDHPESEESQFTSDKKQASRPADNTVSQYTYEWFVSFEGKHPSQIVVAESFMEAIDTASRRTSSYISEEPVAVRVKNIEEEDKMTSDQKEKRDEYVKGMKKKEDEFKERYGKDYKAVMYATATKNAMKESLDENFKEGELELRDGSKVKLSSAEARQLNSLFVSLNDNNQEKMDKEVMSNKKGFNRVLKFASEF